MALINCPELKACAEALVDCFKCEKCETIASKPLHALCPNHIFCEPCALKLTTCPTCQTPLKLENINRTFAAMSEMLPLLQRLRNVVGPEEKNKEIFAPTKKQNESKLIGTPVNVLQSENESKESSPATSKSSNRRRSSMGNAQDVNKRNQKGETLLHVACNKGKIDEVTRLLELGAKCATKDFAGWTPLHEVAQQGRVELARLLLEHGAGANVPGDNLNTPLHEAMQNGSVEMVKLLVQFGARADQQNLYGYSPRDMAKDPALLVAISAPAETLATPKSPLSDFDSILSCDYRHIVVMSAGLDSSQQSALKFLVKSSQLTSTVTPSKNMKVIVTAATRNICERSVAVLSGLSLGTWIVSPEWLEVCHKNGTLVDPEPFEIYGVAGHITAEAPKISRQNCKNLMPGLFAGCHFYFHGNFNLIDGLSRKILTDLVEYAGGELLSRCPDAESIPEKERTVPFHAPVNGPLTKLSHIVIYQPGTREPQLKYNMQHIKTLPYLWLLACIENFTLLDPQKM